MSHEIKPIGFHYIGCLIGSLVIGLSSLYYWVVFLPLKVTQPTGLLIATHVMSRPCFHQRSMWLLPLPCAWQLVPDRPHPDGDLGLKSYAWKMSFLLGRPIFRWTCDFCAVGSQNLLLASCFLVDSKTRILVMYWPN